MRRKRRHLAPRCEGCGLHLALCVCDRLPRVALSFRWVLVQHGVEVDRPTNTGRMVRRMLAPVEEVLYGRRGRELDASPLEAGDTDYLVLFPGGEAGPLAPDRLRPRPGRRLAVVLLDGTWRQAAHMAGRIPALRRLPRVRLPAGPPGRWVIRTPREPHQLCTLEAAIRVVELAGRADDARDLRIAMEWIQLRMLYMKGRRPRPADRPEAQARVETRS